MSKFNVDDRVRIVNDEDETYGERVLGKTGTIISTSWASNDQDADIRWYSMVVDGDERPYNIYEKNLEPEVVLPTYPFTVREGSDALAQFKTREAAEAFITTITPKYTIEETF
jgi:hypothetical protein